MARFYSVFKISHHIKYNCKTNPLVFCQRFVSLLPSLVVIYFQGKGVIGGKNVKKINYHVVNHVVALNLI